MPYLTSGSATPSTPSGSRESSSNAFEELVQDLSIALGPTSGLDSDDVDPLNIQRLMELYTSNQDEWHSFALEDLNRSYTRNLIDEGNGKSNLLILVWSPGRGSTIHDHANAHCVMKVLKGTLQETLYTWPDQERVERGQVSPPQVKKVTTYGENQVTYMSDKVGWMAPLIAEALLISQSWACIRSTTRIPTMWLSLYTFTHRRMPQITAFPSSMKHPERHATSSSRISPQLEANEHDSALDQSSWLVGSSVSSSHSTFSAS